MKASKDEGDKILLPCIDLTGEDGDLCVEVEIDHIRGVLYVHAQGQSVLRVCRSKFTIVEHKET